MNNDLISRSELKKAITNWFANERYYHPLDKPTNLSEVIAMIIVDNAPTVEERPQGEWIYDYDDFYHCSICGKGICTEWDKLSLKKYFPFCHCGAKMKGGAE